MFLAILTFLSALTISAVAIYYSVAGLAAIFAAAVIPIIIMGVSLEIGKLVTAVWLHRNWNRAVWWLKTYLAVAVVVLMFITSMGIFGYLSKAHIEQTSMSIEQVAQIDTLEEKMIRSTAKVDRWTSEIDRLLKGDNVRVDTLIEKEQDALSKVYARINEEKKLANDQATSDIQLLTNDKESAQSQADREIKLQNDRLDQAKERKEADIAAAQKKFEESFGGAKKLEEATEKAKANELSVASAAQREIKSINKNLNEKLNAIDLKIDDVRKTLTTTLARIDSTYNEQVSDIQKRIANLRGQANIKTADIDGRITELEGFIDTETVVVDKIREEKAVFEKTFRQLEADVGPIKYIAEFIYGQEADANLLERAVRWVIIIIIFVFDPLAVLLLIASQYSFMYRKEPSWGGVMGGFIPPNRDDDDPKDDDDPDPVPPAPPTEEVDAFDEDEVKYDMTPMTEEEEYRNAGITKEEAEKQADDFIKSVMDKQPEQMELNLEFPKEVEEPDPRQMELDFDAPITPKLTDQEIKELDDGDEEWKKAKAQWKDDNPNEQIKTQKVAYAVGKITEFPWEKNYRDMKVNKDLTESEKMQEELEPINELDEAMEDVDNVDKWNNFIDDATKAAEEEDQKKRFTSTNYFTKVSNKQLLKETKEAPEDETTTQK
ncbi:MAG: hypothetical protein CMA31_01915 [Euryarchaeota archaeon]|nr:hypothetical protein [Euryarchaeota archaeon]